MKIGDKVKYVYPLSKVFGQCGTFVETKNERFYCIFNGAKYSFSLDTSLEVVPLEKGDPVTILPGANEYAPSHVGKIGLLWGDSYKSGEKACWFVRFNEGENIPFYVRDLQYYSGQPVVVAVDPEKPIPPKPLRILNAPKT